MRVSDSFAALVTYYFYCTFRNITIEFQMLHFEGVTLERSEPATKKRTQGSIPPQMTALRSHRFTERRLIKTLTNYIFSESLITEDYHKISTERKKLNALKI